MSKRIKKHLSEEYRKLLKEKIEDEREKLSKATSKKERAALCRELDEHEKELNSIEGEPMFFKAMDDYCIDSEKAKKTYNAGVIKNIEDAFNIVKEAGNMFVITDNCPEYVLIKKIYADFLKEND